MSLNVVNALGMNVLVGEADGYSRSFSGTLNFFSDSPTTLLDQFFLFQLTSTNLKKSNLTRLKTSRTYISQKTNLMNTLLKEQLIPLSLFL